MSWTNGLFFPVTLRKDFKGYLILLLIYRNITKFLMNTNIVDRCWAKIVLNRETLLNSCHWRNREIVTIWEAYGASALGEMKQDSKIHHFG